MAVFVLDRIHPAGVDYLRGNVADLVLWDDPRIAAWHEEAEGVIIRGRKLSSADIENAPRLRVIAKQGVGTESIALDAARDRGIVVCNRPGINSETVAEMAIALAISVARRIVEYDRMTRAGVEFDRSDYNGVSCWKKTVGVVGMGNIGSQVAAKWHNGFGANLIGYDPYASADAWAELPHVRAATIDELVGVADFVTLCVPLTPETNQIIGARELGLMKSNAVLVNVSRGRLVDEDALYDALTSNRLFGAGLDVFAVEPPPADHPLLSCSRVVATPHGAGSTEDNQVTSARAVAEDLVTVLRGGEPVHRVV